MNHWLFLFLEPFFPYPLSKHICTSRSAAQQAPYEMPLEGNLKLKRLFSTFLCRCIPFPTACLLASFHFFFVSLLCRLPGSLLACFYSSFEIGILLLEFLVCFLNTTSTLAPFASALLMFTLIKFIGQQLLAGRDFGL